VLESFLVSRYRFCWQCFFECSRPWSLTKSLSSAPPNQAPVPGCRHSSCVLIMHVCLSVCASVKYVSKVININKYKQNHDDVMCSIYMKREIDVHSDVKQVVKWQVFRHLIA